MKLKRKASLIVATFALVTAFAGTAAAQAPTVTFQQNGAQVFVSWTPVAGASTYDIVVAGSLSGTVQVPGTAFSVTPPPGTYILQVRGRNGGTVGPLSDPVTINVGGS